MTNTLLSFFLLSTWRSSFFNFTACNIFCFTIIIISKNKQIRNILVDVFVQRTVKNKYCNNLLYLFAHHHSSMPGCMDWNFAIRKSLTIPSRILKTVSKVILSCLINGVEVCSPSSVLNVDQQFKVNESAQKKRVWKSRFLGAVFELRD